MPGNTCHVCGKTLTEFTSVKLGIGPICRAKEATMPMLDLFNHAEFTVCEMTDDFIYIKDTGGNSGSRTVTNDPEFVIKQLSEEYDLENRRVFYMDTSGRIDEIVHKDGCFAMFAPGHQGVELCQI